MADELTALVRAGHHRLVLNFAAVERMSSQIVGAVAAAHRRCAAADGGQLRLCGLRPELAEVFALTGLAGPVAIFPDERAALDTPWPDRRGPRPLPVSVLAALSRRASAIQEDADATIEAPDASTGDEPATPRLRLVGLSRKARGRTVEVGSSPFVIGRERSCQLHADWPEISRCHAAIERVEGGWVLSDLASTNGTVLNGRLFRDAAEPLSEGDTIRVGPLRFTVLLGERPEPRSLPDDMVASWLRDNEPADDAYSLTSEDDMRSEVATTRRTLPPASRLMSSRMCWSSPLASTISTPILPWKPSAPASPPALAASTTRQVVINLECVAVRSPAGPSGC